MAPSMDALADDLVAESADLRALNLRLTREIAERERMQKELRVAEQTVQQSSKLAALGEMSAGVSHELNQPLAAMKTYLAGARLLLGGERPERPGAWYPATVLAGVAPGQPAHDEEVFGPVAAVIAARDEADAIRIANDSEFGLGSGVLTTDLARGERWNNHLGRGWPIAQRGMRAHRIVVPAPALNQDLGLAQTVEDLPIQQLVSVGHLRDADLADGVRHR